MFATRYEWLNNARRPRDGRHLLTAFLRCTALSRGICRRGAPSPQARPRGPTPSKPSRTAAAGNEELMLMLLMVRGRTEGREQTAKGRQGKASLSSANS